METVPAILPGAVFFLRHARSSVPAGGRFGERGREGARGTGGVGGEGGRSTPAYFAESKRVLAAKYALPFRIPVAGFAGRACGFAAHRGEAAASVEIRFLCLKSP